ncbi:MAG: potassium transporter Kup [Microthrixaceae bacterium]
MSRATASNGALTLGALGVVFGDIGTSPLYALREAFLAHHGRRLVLESANVVGLLSLVLWSLILVVSVKYLLVVMRADNGGEGGILALTALIRPTGSLKAGGSTRWLIVLGLFGASLLYGDGMITPAISVLSAVVGTSVVSGALDRYVPLISVVILVGLFSVQRHGTAAVGRVFGPVMVVWFATLGLLGASHISDHPAVLGAILPHHAVRFLLHNGILGFLVLGSVVLAITGAEALYADMGHFGRKPITRAWYFVVLPGLVLCYFGQGAMVLNDPRTIDNPFYRMAPRWALWPLVVLATSATVIASQALISGAFSLTRQAVQLGYLPRVRISHTSESEEGQIYVPAINTVLLVACIVLVVGFKTSTNLAAAYGLAVTGTMGITTILLYRVARTRFGWRRIIAVPMCSLFLVIDLMFLGANLPKIPDGGWVPLVIGGVFLLVLTTWFAGRKLTAERMENRFRRVEDFIDELETRHIMRGPGVGVYLGPNPDLVPQALSSHLKHAGVLPRNVLLLAIRTANVPHVERDAALAHDDLGDGIHRLVYTVGFSDDVDVPSMLETDGTRLTGIDFSRASYVLGRETLRVTDRPGMARWREHLFLTMVRNATTADVFFKLPPDRTIELGVQVEL